MEKPFVYYQVDLYDAPEIKFNPVIFLPASEYYDLKPAFRKESTSLLGEDLHSTWGVLNLRRSAKRRVGDERFNTPQEAMDFAEAELRRVYSSPVPETQTTIPVRFVDVNIQPQP